jgi:hypothetical protein
MLLDRVEMMETTMPTRLTAKTTSLRTQWSIPVATPHWCLPLRRPSKTNLSILFTFNIRFLSLTEPQANILLSTALDQFASKEGLPAGLDPEMNNLVNDEVNKF